MLSISRLARLSDAANIEKIVDYSFERNEKSNVLAIHPTRPLIAYLINIQRQPKISKGWSSGNDTLQSPASSSINVHLSSSNDKIKTVSIRIIDYQTRQRCLAKGVYHARPADCVFSINSLQCTQADIIKLAVVDRLANIYLYDVSYFINDLTATRIAVIRAPGQDLTPYDSISLVWCPFVPCEDFDDGDGGLRLALATNKKIEIFAIDRIQGRTGELQRNELKGAYKNISDAHKTNIVTLSISPDCSTISSAALDNRITFFSSDIDDGGQRCLHNWEASITDKSSISKLFFLDDYQKLLNDSTMKFWGAAFIGTKSGQMLLVDLRNWSVYQRINISTDSSETKNFDYQIDLTSRNIIAMNGNQCFVIQIEHGSEKQSSKSSKSNHNPQQNELNLIDVNNPNLMNGNILNYLLQSSSTTQQSQNQKISPSLSTKQVDCLPHIVKTTRMALQSTIYSFVIKHKSEDELELFTISAYSLERYIINLNTLNSEAAEEERIPSPPVIPVSELKPSTELNNLDVHQVDRLVEALFTKLNTAFSQGLDEFLNDVKGEVNDLKLKLNGLCRDVRKLQQQLQEARQK